MCARLTPSDQPARSRHGTRRLARAWAWARIPRAVGRLIMIETVYYIVPQFRQGRGQGAGGKGGSGRVVWEVGAGDGGRGGKQDE